MSAQPILLLNDRLTLFSGVLFYHIFTLRERTFSKIIFFFFFLLGFVVYHLGIFVIISFCYICLFFLAPADFFLHVV